MTREKGRLKDDKINNGWWRRFLERNPSLSLRSGDATAGIRMDAINHENITSYFDLWIDQELFHFRLQDHFLTHAGSHRPLLLLLDGHSSHFSPATIRFAKKNDVAMFCLPPHTTHECQPLDCSLFGPLKVHWKQECHVFYQKNAGRVLSKLNFCGVFRDAWFKAITPDNMCSGFRKAGVYPFNPQAVATSSR